MCLHIFIKGGFALNRLAKTCKECLDFIIMFKLSKNNDYLIIAAWLYVYGIQSSLEKWGWNPFSVKIYIPNYQHCGRLSLYAAILIILSQISKLSKNDPLLQETINNIINDDKTFIEYSSQNPYELKKKLKP